MTILLRPGTRLDRSFVRACGVLVEPATGCSVLARDFNPGEGDGSICVALATYGNRRWIERGAHAATSVSSQSVAPSEFIWVHGRSLHGARNSCAGLARSEFIVFLDADDELDEGFVAAMGRAPKELDIVRPSVSLNGAQARLADTRDLRRTNFIYISSRVRLTSFRQVGGFRSLPVLEDWDLWLRMWLSGATVGGERAAVLKKAESGSGRNSASNEIVRWQLQRSWSRLPTAHGGLAPSGAAHLLRTGGTRRLTKWVGRG